MIKFKNKKTKKQLKNNLKISKENMKKIKVEILFK